MMNTRKQRLAIAVAGTLGLMASSTQAADFNATTTLQNTLTVVSLQDFDIGTVFASATGASDAVGVGALIIAPDGTVTVPGTLNAAPPSLISLGAPTPAQGSVDMANDFSLQLPDTNGLLAADFADASTGTMPLLLAAPDSATFTEYTELVHESSDPDVPSLYLMHFTIEDVSGGVSTEDDDTDEKGLYAVAQDFGETTYVFNIGATLTTEPTVGTAQKNYEEGVYSGTFEVTASY